MAVPIVSNAGFLAAATAEAAKVFYLMEYTRNHCCSDGVSILPVETRRKGKLVQIVSNSVNI